MADTVRLRHAAFGGDWMEYFYDGQLPVHDAVIEVPINRPEWIRRVWVLGFRLDLNRQDVTDLEAYVRREQARDAEETVHESANAGGLTDTEDGVRESSPESGPSVPEIRNGGRRRYGARTRTKL